jgi:methionyl-tRNA synthetase
MSDIRSAKWQFTAYESQWKLFIGNVPAIVAEVGWQTEKCPDTGRLHYQGFIRTTSQQRFSALKKVYPGVHIEPARNWDALVAYCKKNETALPDSQVHKTSDYMNKFQYMDHVCEHLANHFRGMGFVEIDEMWDEIMLYTNVLIAMGKSYLAWIVSDPNFKITFRQSGRALVLGKSRQTDRQN